MKKSLLLTCLILLSIVASAAKPKHRYIEIRTDFGTCIIRLYNETPLHKDNFIRLIKEKVYDGVLFHRVIEHFMIQGGDPDSKNARPGEALGEGDLGYRIPSEFRDSLFHKKGALAAARDDNPEKESSSCQFYIVQGKKFTDEQLDRLEVERLNGRTIPDYQRKIYKSIGGTPHLDQNYTVFGEVVEGIEMIDKIAAVPTDNRDRPIVDQSMTIRILKNGEVRRLEKRLGIRKSSGIFDFLF